MIAYTKRVAEIVVQEPAVTSFFANTGCNGGMDSTNSSNLNINLKPRRQRK